MTHISKKRSQEELCATGTLKMELGTTAEHTNGTTPAPYDVYVIKPLWMTVTRALTLAVISFLALFGNVLVVTAVIKYRRLRTSANVFVANLAVSNGITGVLLVFMTWNVVLDRNALGAPGCKTWGFFTGAALICSTLTMSLVALNRYVLIAHARKYRMIFNLRKCVMMSVIAWLVGMSLSIGAVTGWSEIRYNPLTKACSYSRDVGVSFHYFGIVLGFMVPLITVIVCYSLLYYTVWMSKRRIEAQNVQKNNVQADEKVNKISEGQPEVDSRKQFKKKQTKSADIKLTKMLVTIFLVYLVCLGPYSMANMADPHGAKFPEVVHVFITWLLFANAAINPFIYGFMNKNFRDGYLALVGSHCECTKRIVEKSRLDIGESTVIVKTSV